MAVVFYQTLGIDVSSYRGEPKPASWSSLASCLQMCGSSMKWNLFDWHIGRILACRNINKITMGTFYEESRRKPINLFRKYIIPRACDDDDVWGMECLFLLSSMHSSLKMLINRSILMSMTALALWEASNIQLMEACQSYSQIYIMRNNLIKALQ